MLGFSLTYRDAGVDIDAGEALVQRIAPRAKTTASAGANGELGGFGGLFDLKACGLKDPILVAATDGVGTKLKIAIESGHHNTVGIDLVAMCVNDLIVQGAQPLFFLDYFGTGKLNINTAESVIDGIAEGCKQAGCALIGGETAELPGLYSGADYDLAGFAVGAVERDRVLPRRDDIKTGDVILGLESDGLHSNGFSLVRRVVEHAGLRWTDPAPYKTDAPDIATALLTPTRLYVRSVIAALRDNLPIKGLAHITGGGLTENLPRILPPDCAAEIECAKWQAHPVFEWLADAGNIAKSEMLRTFNCGIGMVLVVAADSADAITAHFEKSGERVHRIGRIIPRDTAPVNFLNI